MREAVNHKTQCMYTAFRIRRSDGAMRVRDCESHPAAIVADIEHDRFSLLDEAIGRMITVPASAVYEALMKAGGYDPHTQAKE